jgi:hypothetical protein
VRAPDLLVALVRHISSTLAAVLNDAALAAAVLDALVRLISSTLAAALNDATLAATVCLALVRLISSTLAAALNDATLAATVCLALVRLTSTKLLTSLLNTFVMSVNTENLFQLPLLMQPSVHLWLHLPRHVQGCVYTVASTLFFLLCL